MSLKSIVVAQFMGRFKAFTNQRVMRALGAFIGASLFAFSPLFAQDLPVGAGRLDVEFRGEWISSTLQKGMAVGGDGLSKTYAYTHGSDARSASNTDFGESMLLTASLRPHAAFYADGQFSVLGNYADRLWRPINDLHRQETSDERIRFRRGEIFFQSGPARVRLLQGKPYAEWTDRGDLFGFLPAQYELDRYLNFAGHAVPRAVEGGLKTPVGEFTVLAGPEVVWGYGPSVYARYNATRNAVRYALVYKNETISFGDIDEKRRALEAVLATDEGGAFPMTFGLLYQPFRLDRPFVRAEKALGGQGSFGSGFRLSDDRTSGSDAWGAAFQIACRPAPFFERAEAGYSYRGAVAGNKQETFAALSKRFTPQLSSRLRYVYRQPIFGPVPLVQTGTESSPGALLANPRGPDDPFAVDWDSRKAHLFTWTWTQDPTPTTWLFRYSPDIFETYNINEQENARLAFGFQYSLAHYPTSTDRTYYHDKEGNVVWEGAFHSGAWPTRAPLHSAAFMVHSRTARFRNLLVVHGGESLATSGLAYTALTDRNKGLTPFFRVEDELSAPPYRFSLLFSIDDWGPEEFQRRFGETFDRLFRAGAERVFAGHIKLGLFYTRAREEDNRFLAPSLGGFDEWALSFSYRFGALFQFAGSGEGRAPKGGS